ncbi:polysaccharide deacetylase family protein [Membranihabitans maritimus]|uniref:polysaccharide deacetylase family protein n=1 Tax=Membranihabitans maritimus TaxID=2904244 RepID=UPI001F1B9C93|nr:polysaccharide deacetylase family protein [Membranihabitans maritimus]
MTKVQAQETYAEKLGYPKGARIIILHVDDAGMSWDSNKGTRDAIDRGMANSFSVMMPCPWVPAIVRYIKQTPTSDAGLHLTLTSEWHDYRWGPLMGKPAVPGLVDPEGCLWRSVDQVVKNASPDEVEAEIRAQIDRALTMGFEPTHLDSHMGTLFADPDFLQRYIKVGAEYEIPVMFPGGHNTVLREEYRMEVMHELKKSGKWKDGMDVPVPEILDQAPGVGQKVWSMGLPVLDDLHNISYGWGFPSELEPTDENIQKFYTGKYLESFKMLQPGLTLVLMHCTHPSEIFDSISSSGVRRKGDLLAMMDPKLKNYIEKEGIILTTWKEVMERRKAIK